MGGWPAFLNPHLQAGGCGSSFRRGREVRKGCSVPRGTAARVFFFFFFSAMLFDHTSVHPSTSTSCPCSSPTPSAHPRLHRAVSTPAYNTSVKVQRADAPHTHLAFMNRDPRSQTTQRPQAERGLAVITSRQIWLAVAREGWLPAVEPARGRCVQLPFRGLLLSTAEERLFFLDLVEGREGGGRGG